MLDQDQEPCDQAIGLGGFLVVAFGTLLAVPGVFLDMFIGNGGVGGFLGPVVAGPLIEETLKPIGLVILLTLNRRLVFGTPTGILCGVYAGLVFASIENLIYLNVYFSDHDPSFATWRWTVCVGVHAICSGIVGLGLASSSQVREFKEDEEFALIRSASPHLLDSPRERHEVFQGPSLICLVIATILHGLYNFAAIALDVAK